MALVKEKMMLEAKAKKIKSEQLADQLELEKVKVKAKPTTGHAK
jgi:hypothetical protein